MTSFRHKFKYHYCYSVGIRLKNFTIMYMHIKYKEILIKIARICKSFMLKNVSLIILRKTILNVNNKNYQ